MGFVVKNVPRSILCMKVTGTVMGVRDTLMEVFMGVLVNLLPLRLSSE